MLKSSVKIYSMISVNKVTSASRDQVSKLYFYMLEPGITLSKVNVPSLRKCSNLLLKSTVQFPYSCSLADLIFDLSPPIFALHLHLHVPFLSEASHFLYHSHLIFYLFLQPHPFLHDVYHKSF